MKVTVHYEREGGQALCRFIQHATLTDFEHEVTCEACKAKLEGTSPAWAEAIVDCPHCGRRHGRRYACDDLLAAAS